MKEVLYHFWNLYFCTQLKREAIMRGLNPDQLRAFLEVLELGSFTAAAKKLNLSQPAVSLQIRELEAKCGVSLLDRSGRRPLPTAAGQQLVVHARRIMAESDEALSAMHRMKSSALGIVRLGMTTPALTYLARDPIRRIRRDMCDTALVLSLAPSRRLVELVREGEVDIAIVSLPFDPTNLDVRIIVDEDIVGIGPEGLTGEGNALTPEIMSTLPFYVQGNPDVQMSHAMSWFRSAGLSPQAWIEVETLEACCAAASAGLGATIAPAGMAAHMKIGRLDPPIKRTIALISRTDVKLSRPAQAISNILGESIKTTVSSSMRENVAEKPGHAAQIAATA